MIPQVPVDAKRPDWPRLAANAINALILEIANMKPFAPTGSTVNIAVSGSSQRISVGRPDQVRVQNNGTATVWIALGASTVTTAATTGAPVGPGVTEVWSVPSSLSGADVYVAAIAAAATGTIYFTPGSGL